METFAKRLKGLRKEKKRTQAQMADYLQCSLRAYQYYESATHYPEIPDLWSRRPCSRPPLPPQKSSLSPPPASRPSWRWFSWRRASSPWFSWPQPFSTYYCCEHTTSKVEADKCDFMTWDVPVKDDCPACGQTMFKKAARRAP